jgi:O-antigen/teichoic acid export membrane protein
MIIFLGVGLGIDFFKLFIDKDYHEGLSIVPVVLMANVLVGLLFNVNMWYKLSGDTLYGVYITGIGALITVGFNILFIPEFGYIACAWTHLLSNGIMLALTYFIGQKKFKIYYDVRAVGLYIGLALLLYGIGRLLRSNFVWLNLVLAIVFVVLYFFYCNKRENLIGIFLKKHES